MSKRGDGGVVKVGWCKCGGVAWKHLPPSHTNVHARAGPMNCARSLPFNDRAMGILSTLEELRDLSSKLSAYLTRVRLLRCLIISRSGTQAFMALLETTRFIEAIQ
jgi:hypothetical protein